MKLLITLICCLVCSMCCFAADSIRKLDGAKISVPDAEAFARKTLTGNHVTGAQIAVINDGRLVWSQAFGKRGVNPDLPMDRETTTWAASITKSVFATYVMRLVETEGFKLDEPIWENVTPRMILSHTSGLLNFASMEPDKQKHVHFTPGTKFNYSGEGYNLLQSVIEERQKRTIGDLMEEAIFTPLAMKRTGMIFRPEFEANIADRFDLDEKFHAQTRRGPARAAGSMTSTADDLARFAIAFMSDKIIKPGTRRAMLTPVIQIKSLHQFPGYIDPRESPEGPADGLAYGSGWGLLTKTTFGPAFFKEGHGDGAQNYMICFERHKDCMIVLTNSDNGELSFRPLFEKILGDTVTPWEWEGYTLSAIEEGRKSQ